MAAKRRNTNPALKAARKVFFDESRECLEDAAARLSRIEAAGQPDDGEINAIFRAIHSVKGGSAAWGFTAVQELSHAYEAVLGALRDGKIGMSGKIPRLLLEANDRLGGMIDDAESDEADEDGTWRVLQAELEDVLKIDPSPSPPVKGTAGETEPNAVELGPVLDDTAFEEIAAAVADRNKGGGLVFDCRNVDRISVLGLQILLAHARETHDQGLPFALTNISETLAATLRTLGLSDDLTALEGSADS